MTERQKNILDEWSRKLLWALIVGLVSYGVNEIKSISQSLHSLNSTVMLLSEKLNTASEASREYKGKLEALEHVVFKLEKDVILCKHKE